MLKKRKVYVIGPTYNFDYILQDYGYEVFTDKNVKDVKLTELDLAIWMGGTDIQTKLYGEVKLMVTQTPNSARDAREIALFHQLKNTNKLGICRGAQLLCVLNGGSLYQDVDGHEFGNHWIEDVWGGKVMSSSVHHQMCRPHKDTEVIAWATPNRCSYRQTGEMLFEGVPNEKEPEIMWAPATKSLMIQGHPEFGPATFETYSMRLIERYFFTSASAQERMAG